MARRIRQSPRAKALNVKVDDYVLLGGSRASYPGTWSLGYVLWAGKGDICVERSTQNGETWREVRSVEEVRARGTIAELVATQDAARKAVQELTRQVHECESALGSARDRVFAKLDELAEGGVAVIPPDFDAMDARGRQIRERVNRDDEERMGAKP